MEGEGRGREGPGDLGGPPRAATTGGDESAPRVHGKDEKKTARAMREKEEKGVRQSFLVHAGLTLVLWDTT